MAEILKRDEQTGIQYGVNDMGQLFIGDRLCWFTAEDTPENREKMLAEWEYSVEQKREAETPAKMAPGQWTGADYKFQVNAAHIAAIYDELDGQLKRFGRMVPRQGLDVQSFLAGAKAALQVMAANTPHVWDWCHLQEVNRRYFDADE